METEKNKKILIIDDVSSIRALFARFLKLDGYETVEAESGEEALKLAQEIRFDGILLDLNMPGIDGLETCRKLRALKGYKITPILVVTSNDKTSILSDAFDAGCDDFIRVLVLEIARGFVTAEVDEGLDAGRTAGTDRRRDAAHRATAPQNQQQPQPERALQP